MGRLGGNGQVVTMPAEIVATYYVEGNGEPERFAETLAGEMSSGTFVRVAASDADQVARSAARIVELAPVSSPPALPSLPTRRDNAAADLNAVLVTIAIPVDNIAANLPALAATVCGNVFELGEITGMKLMSLELPPGYRDCFQRPRHGIAGTRALLDVPDRPLFGSIIKPSVGLTAQETADVAYELAVAGLDFIKDDELQTNAPRCPISERIDLVSTALDRAADRVGRRALYAFNITDSWENMCRHRDRIHRQGATAALMVTVNTVGIVATQALVRGTEQPVHAHRAGWGLIGRHPALGISFPAYQTIARLTGIDHLHTSGLKSKFSETDDEVTTSILACLTRLSGSSDDRVLPVLSAGQTCLHLEPTLDAVESTDVLMLAGGGILGHPGGAKAGVESFHEAFLAHEAGQSLDQRAVDNTAVRDAIATFSGAVS